VRIALLFVLALCVCAATSTDERYQVDKYNAFVGAWNVYTGKLQLGITDLKALKQMRAAWRNLEQSAGWPEEKPCR
jgi:hypothetical protein